MKRNLVKLNRLRRIKRRATRPEKFDRFARLYWRQHFRVYGPHQNIWHLQGD